MNNNFSVKTPCFIQKKIQLINFPINYNKKIFQSLLFKVRDFISLRVYRILK
jgi:hypothetical protein